MLTSLCLHVKGTEVFVLKYYNRSTDSTLTKVETSFNVHNSLLQGYTSFLYQTNIETLLYTTPVLILKVAGVIYPTQGPV